MSGHLPRRRDLNIESPVARSRRQPSSEAARSRGRLDSPATPAAVAGLSGIAFVLARLFLVAHGNITRFVFAGSRFVNPARAPKGLHVFHGTGYDGQFYYRLALDPLDLSKTAFGITFDRVFRVERIGFPVLSWIVSGGGHASAVPWAMVVVNLVAFASLGWLGAIFARDAGRHAVWGLLFPAFWGLLFSMGRDLPEVVASAFLLAALLLLRRRRWWAAGLLLAGAVLTIETTFDVVLAVAVVSVARVLWGRRRPGSEDLAWVIPVASFGAWQLYGWEETGKLPFRNGAGDNLAVPVVNMVRAVGHFLATWPSSSSTIWLSEFAVLAVVTIVAAWSISQSRVTLWERVAWGIALLVALSLSKGIWSGRADFRGFEDLYLLSAVVMVGSRRRLWIPVALLGVLWAATFVHRAIRL